MAFLQFFASRTQRFTLGKYRIGLSLGLWSLFLALGLAVGDGRAWSADTGVRSPFVVVTDVDDTVKITYISSPAKVMWKGFWGTDTFTGMSELFQELDKDAQEIVYLSSALQSSQAGIQETLVYTNGFPPGYFQFNNWLRLTGPGAFKRKELVRLKDHPTFAGLPFMMFGDDTQGDPEIYLEHQSANLERQKDFPIYIHKVNNRALPNGVTPFYTALDVALNEVIQNRFNAEQAIRVGRAILNSDRKDLLIPPDFAACPTELHYPIDHLSEMSTELAEVSRQVKDYIESFCKERMIK